MTCEHLVRLGLVATTAACVTTSDGTQVDVILSSPGVSAPHQDSQGRAWQIAEAQWSVEGVVLLPCEEASPASTARLASPRLLDLDGRDNDGSASHTGLRLPEPIDPDPVARHGVLDSGLAGADAAMVDLRMQGTAAGWTLTPPLATWCTVEVHLGPSPAVVLDATGPWHEQMTLPDAVDVQVPLPAPLTLDADHLTETVWLTVDPAAWLGAIDAPGGSAHTLDAALRLGTAPW